MVNSRAFSQPHVPLYMRIVFPILNWLLPLLRLGNKRFVRVEQAAKAVVDITVADKYAGQEGYFEGTEKVSSSPASLDVDLQKALWARSIEWCKLEGKDVVIDI
ncbi:hypothetical protein NX059_000057 [Plenodomus lindquistii]|nr:hypothetical protein NX059_000057 [Plenodomus lindquistii]